MNLSTTPTLDKRKDADALILPCWQGEKRAEIAEEAKSFSSAAETLLKSGDFKGKEGEIATLYLDKGKEKRLVLLGLGKKSEAKAEGMRKALAALISFALTKKWKELNLLFPQAWASPAIEGALLASYQFNALKGTSLKEEGAPSLQKITLVGASPEVAKECLRIETIASAVNFTRDLVNGNADDITPQKLCEVAEDLAHGVPSLKVSILNKKALEKEKLGLLLAVARGAARDPALIILEYKGNPKKSETTAIVGKGITYDTGGLNIKPTGSMETMKCDMSGAAAVLGTIKAAIALRLKVNIIGVIATTENGIGSRAYKPGDVYRSHSGKTVEISNTDAEGRLVLADALSYLEKEYKPSRIIDLATLTGGVVVALGEEVTGFFATDDKLAQELVAAGEKTFERLWRLPLYPEYRDLLKSHIADIKNSGKREASPIQGAIFLKDFVRKETPWAHLDIAGTAYLSKPKHYHSTPATGVGVRLLVELLSREV